MRKINLFLSKLHVALFIPLFAIIGIVPSMLFPRLWRLGDDYLIREHYSIHVDGEIALILTNVIILPFLVTSLFQLLPYKLLSRHRFFKGNMIWLIIISGLLLGAFHSYSLHYIMFAFVVGMIYMYAFMLRIDKKPFLTVFALHIFTNGVVMLIGKVFSIVL